MTFTWKHFGSWLAGVAVAWLVGLMLWPLMLLAIDQFFHLDLFSNDSAGMSRDDMILLAIFMSWFFIACTCGGIVCSLEQPRKYNLLACVICQLVILAVMVGIDIYSMNAPEPWLMLAMIPAGYFTGGWLGRKFIGKDSNEPPQTTEVIP